MEYWFHCHLLELSRTFCTSRAALPADAEDVAVTKDALVEGFLLRPTTNRPSQLQCLTKQVLFLWIICWKFTCTCNQMKPECGSRYSYLIFWIITNKIYLYCSLLANLFVHLLLLLLFKGQWLLGGFWYESWELLIQEPCLE